MTRAFLFLVGVAAVALAPVARAMQLELSRPELCDLSEEVVIGEITDLETRWTAQPGGGIERVVHVAVSERFKGDRSVDSLEITLPGGQIGDLGHWVEDVPKLMVNGQYLLFLGTAMDGTVQVVGGEQGAVRITGPNGRIGERLDEARSTVEVCRARK